MADDQKGGRGFHYDNVTRAYSDGGDGKSRTSCCDNDDSSAPLAPIDQGDDGNMEEKEYSQP